MTIKGPDHSNKNQIPPAELPHKPPTEKKGKIKTSTMVQWARTIKSKSVQKAPRPQPVKSSALRPFLNFAKKIVRDITQSLPPKISVPFFKKNKAQTSKTTQESTHSQENLSGYTAVKGLEKLRQAQEAQDIVENHLENLEELEAQLTDRERAIHKEWGGDKEEITLQRAFSPIMIAKNKELFDFVKKSQKTEGGADFEIHYCPKAVDVLNETDPEEFQKKLLDLVATSLDHNNSPESINLGSSRNEVKKHILAIMDIEGATSMFSTELPKITLKEGINFETRVFTRRRHMTGKETKAKMRMDIIKDVIASTLGHAGINHQSMWSGGILGMVQKNNPALTLPQ